MRRLIVTFALGAGVAAQALLVQAQEDRERCYGVAPAGANDGIGEEAEPGGATVDYQGDAWTWVEPGACLTLPVPPRADGAPRRGSYEPLARDRP